ncbi:Dolichol phosphate-mannose biosynthesis regulatory protein [Mactra antiquata]
MSDQLVGAGLLTCTGLAFLYYTLWVIVLPFVDDEQTLIHNMFPDRKFAIILPLLAGVIGLICIGSFVGVVILKSPTKEKKS